MKKINAIDYIKARQKMWAKRQGLDLQGSKQKRGDLIYTKSISDNLFDSLNKDFMEQIPAGYRKRGAANPIRYTYE